MDKKENVEVVYFNNSGYIVPRENATKCIVRVSDSNGKLIREVFGTIEKPVEEEQRQKGIGSK